MVTHRRDLGRFWVSLPACAGLVGLVGVLRLGHQFPAASSSPALLVPFLLPVLGLSLEAGGLVALSVAQLSALVGAPLPSLAARARAGLPLLGMLGLVLVVAETIPRGTEHPGAFANDLLAKARDSCSQGGKVPVPLLGLSVSCDPPQRIEGPMPGVPSVQIAMRELIFADDLRSVQIAALELQAARSLRVSLRAQSARVVGLAPWSRSPRLSPLARFAVLAGLGAVLWLGACIVLRPSEVQASDAVPPGATRRAARWLVYALFAAPGVVTAALFISLDQDRAAPAAYWVAALLGTLALGLVAVLVRRVPQIFSYFRAL